MLTKETKGKMLDELLRISAVHGVNRIFHKTSTKVERILWSFGVIMATIILSYVTWKIGYIYRYKPLKTVISDLQQPIFKIPFPEVIICNRNRFNFNRYEEAKRKFLLPHHRSPVSPKHERTFLEVINAYDTIRFGKFENFHNLSNYFQPKLLKDLNYINLTQVSELMAWKCNELFTDCSWRGRLYDCCELFSLRKSQQGLCLSFNGIETEQGMEMMEKDSYYPWRTSGIGPENGLELLIHVRESQQSPLRWGFKGVRIMLVEPHVWSYLPHEIPINTKAMVMISADEQFYDETTRVFDTETRQCVFEDEVGSLYYKSLINHKYMFENCQSECQQEYLIKFCNCTVDMFYPPGPYKPCGIVDFPCLYKHNNFLQNFEQVGENRYVANIEDGMDCPCFFSCRSLTYFVDVHIDHGRVSESPIDPNNTQIEMAVFFIWNTIMVYRTTAVYTILDLMASLGGLAGLCIGCSLIGIIEFLYFTFIAVPLQGAKSMKKKRLANQKIKTIKSKKFLVKEKV